MPKAIIDGKRYNTETAELIAKWDNDLSCRDFKHCVIELYKTPRGSWFTCGSGGPMSTYARYIGSGSYTGSSNVIRAISADDARAFLEEWRRTDELEEHFADSIEDA